MFFYDDRMISGRDKFWRLHSRPHAKPLYFSAVLWKPWNARLESDLPRMRCQNLIFELWNNTATDLRKISLVTRTSTDKLNFNVSLITGKYGVEKPEERSSVTKKTISLGAWFLSKKQIPPVPKFSEPEQIYNFLDYWDELNNGIPKKLIKDINKKVKHNISIRNEIKEEFGYASD